MAEDNASADAAPWRHLTTFAVLYASLHHIGFAAAGLGNVGTTRWADWIDMATPYAVLLPAWLAMARAGAGRVPWALLAAGVISYAEGHGIHLSANSIGNVHPSVVAHLWDEVVGHYLCYTGVALVMAALAAALSQLTSPPPGRLRFVTRIALPIAVGVTWATNGLEGGTAPLSFVVAGLFVVTAQPLRRRRLLSKTATHLLWWTFVPALLILMVYGSWFSGFPQPSDLADAIDRVHADGSWPPTPPPSTRPDLGVPAGSQALARYDHRPSHDLDHRGPASETVANRGRARLVGDGHGAHLPQVACNSARCGSR